ncbi:hypothetical protein P12x_002555 [Tundrisphaera lichenicola]|uniref:hypothetical protein n=1 Tax=Tundrisphaera lichenicola TaxID=2029860 RepID=UPI003EB8E81E
MDASTMMPMVWTQPMVFAQATSTGSVGETGSTLVLAFRRWSGSLTLSPPEAVNSPFSPGLWAWLIGLGALLVLALAFQGPGRALGQLLDIPGHARLLASAIGRVRRSGRLLGLAVGISVLAWTTSQSLNYNVATGRDDQLLLTKGRRLVDVALNQGELAALTPLRDVVMLGLMIPLLVGAAVVLFQFSTDRWGSAIRPAWSVRRRSSLWSTVGWGATALYALYRFVGMVTGNADLPLGGCIIVEAGVIPALMVLSDAVLVAWVLVELRNAGLGDQEGEPLDVVGVTLVIPAAALACLLAFPARYVAAAFWLVVANHLPNPPSPGSPAALYLRWQLGWGLIDLQAAALVAVGMLGVVAWSRGTPRDALRGYFRMLAAEGGHLVAALALGGLAAGGISALAYMLVLSLPYSTWALSAADSYAHYGTLPVGLILLAALVELGERSLPMAMLARAESVSDEAPEIAMA